MGDETLVEDIVNDLVRGLPHPLPCVVIVSGGEDSFRDEIIERLRNEIKVKYNGEAERTNVREPFPIRRRRPGVVPRPRRYYTVSLQYFIGKYDPSLC